jgi:hypothetical protein
MPLPAGKTFPYEPSILIDSSELFSVWGFYLHAHMRFRCWMEDGGVKRGRFEGR